MPRLTLTIALICALAAILDELVTIEVPDLLFPEVALQCRKCRRLAASGWFPYGAHIGYMKVNQVTESVQAGHGRSVGRKPLIDQGLGDQLEKAIDHVLGLALVEADLLEQDLGQLGLGQGAAALLCTLVLVVWHGGHFQRRRAPTCWACAGSWRSNSCKAACN